MEERWKTKDGREIKTERSREHQVKIRLNEEEYQTLKQLCFELDMTQSEFFRNAIMQRPNVRTFDMKDIMVELKREGNNLNQIAKTLNAGGYKNLAMIDNATKELVRVWQSLRRLLHQDQ